ncbi:alpha/beta hydrolase [Bacterioplanes sanyensis]|uniref:Alpha/beta hydrolase n=1 Tax=Bacterioplanes sanyensis TaxID=1249553 RepID=A0A222FP15_9GAMM|nr:alpha/beta hydrolase [Bacterioplanes sanyensis]ASP40519.1 alpha/beta hydrolase [Bacterioplanes sanyensis]
MTVIRTPDGIELAYECFGQPHHPSVILIMGLGAHMHIWPDALCQAIAEQGYQVLRFDNRDVGRSSALAEHGTPSLLRTWLHTKLKRKPNIPYTLKDMSRDVIALMDALDIDSAHLVGASMGGMIAQILAAKKKKRVRSLTSIMSAASSPGLPDPRLKVLLQLAKRPPPYNREAAVRYNMRMNRLIGSPGYPLDDEQLRELAETSLARSNDPAGFKRQLVAVTAAGDRRPMLGKIKAPTLVIHGSDDPLIPLRMGIDTAAAIRKAKLKVIHGMGHNLPPALVPRLTKLLAKHLKRAEKKWQKKQLKLHSRSAPLELVSGADGIPQKRLGG